MRLQMFGGTDIGLVRSTNQDALFFSPEYGIAIVSDGMGGHKGGEIASALTISGLRDAFLSSQEILVDNIRGFLDTVLGKINNDIHERAKRDENLHGMGATVNYLMFAGGMVAVGHAGDSRTYLIRSARRPDGSKSYMMWCLTVDHNVGTFVDRGLFVEGRDYRAGTLNEKMRARLTRGMGVLSDLRADLYSRKTQDGDVYLTCTDGLHGFASDAEILRAIVSGPLAKSPQRLIDLAKSKGAPDNVTMVVTAIGENDEPLSAPEIVANEKRNYLTRTPQGEILGPYSAAEIVREWCEENIPRESEVCATLDEWTFLTEKKKLVKRYPDFQQKNWAEHQKRIAPESSMNKGGSYNSYRGERNRQIAFYLVVGVIAILFVIFVVMLSRSKPPEPAPILIPIPIPIPTATATEIPTPP